MGQCFHNAVNFLFSGNFTNKRLTKGKIQDEGELQQNSGHLRKFFKKSRPIYLLTQRASLKRASKSAVLIRIGL